MTNDNYATDNWLMNLFSEWWDPCPLDDDPTENGLERTWVDKTYINPPYLNAQKALTI